MVKLIIKDEKSGSGSGSGSSNKHDEIKIDHNAFRELANNIMEQYPYDEQEDMDEEYDYDDDDDDGPTFTYPSSKSQDDSNNNSNNSMNKEELEVIYECNKEHDETWIYLNQELTNNNTYVISIIKHVGISPDCDSLNEFYYSNYNDNLQWKLLDSLNTILSEPSFAKLCLNDNLSSITKQHNDLTTIDC